MRGVGDVYWGEFAVIIGIVRCRGGFSKLHAVVVGRGCQAYLIAPLSDIVCLQVYDPRVLILVQSAVPGVASCLFHVQLLVDFELRPVDGWAVEN